MIATAATEWREQRLEPVRRADRALAPDLARGAMLLFIALANAAGVVFGGQPGVEPAPHGLERGVNLLLLTLVHARAYPVFAVMFGYGLVQLIRRHRRRAWRRPRSDWCCCAQSLARRVWPGPRHAALLRGFPRRLRPGRDDRDGGAARPRRLVAANGAVDMGGLDDPRGRAGRGRGLAPRARGARARYACRSARWPR